jgi:DNA integrity scanning protein DisA with diadenylate cyclase activity
MGLGARHSAAASISAESKAVAITVSQTTGTVRVFREGEIALELRQKLRRV